VIVAIFGLSLVVALNSSEAQYRQATVYSTAGTGDEETITLDKLEGGYFAYSVSGWWLLWAPTNQIYSAPPLWIPASTSIMIPSWVRYVKCHSSATDTVYVVAVSE